METSLYRQTITFFFCLFALSTFAQDEWNGSTTNSPIFNINDIIYRNGGIRIGHNNPAPANILRMVDADAGTTTYGARAGLLGAGQANGSTAVGDGRGNVGYASSWYANGTVRGVMGYADNVTQLNVGVAGRTSSAMGGYFSANVSDPLAGANLSTGRYYIAGTMGDLSGTINTYPTDGVVAAVFGRDNILGSGTWAGYFQGRGYFDGPVGIATTNPLSTLSVNGDGDDRWSIYGHTTSTVNGNTAIHGEADRPTTFAGNVRGVLGTIESGFGYAFGVSGASTSATPSNSGRSYGVYGVASNATPNYNYGVYGRIVGQNNGTGILGHDNINYPGWSGNTQGTWAGYFAGKVHATHGMSIGTTSMPAMTTVGGNDYLLFVGGGALFEEVKVETGWADYVFEADYELTALEEVEAHIEEKGYLHNTPSAEEVEAEGLNLGDMTVNQQEKIEEIFLHLIDMNKELKTLKAENERLKAELKKIQD
jgi:hypothetical protein